ncbi:uncharacterized protein BKA55DRAFT_598276 [Fusarium redolens]|uniref:DUF5672 domain-containing protein n=1 Tax=Fusarium redolens TaxID=48865 RepID=A0A9P9G5A5_FUSRE|nr:uncharacterized protein BKA55DRAFT_598276 [Fusarium redolens]KAH7232277.1 hypothetical protein BKA55DRAFT_598276 [Fusarium redolens]
MISTLFQAQRQLSSLSRITVMALMTVSGILIILNLTETPLPALPKITLHYANQSIYNESKVALLIENRPQPIIAPLILMFVYQMPPDWKFRFMGSKKSVAHMNSSAAMREHVKSGKLDLTYIPSNMSTAGQEMISRFLTNLWLYDTVLQPAEMLLVFQTDSILCANNKRTIDEFLGYDYVGAPWDTRGLYGGNGGLSIRRVSSIISILQNQQRANDSDPEDVWLSTRLGHHIDGRVANGSVSQLFSGEMNGGPGEIMEQPGRPDQWVKGIDDWRDRFYEPMGYHIGGTGWIHGSIWGTKKKREHIYSYCPEAKMVLEMDWAPFVPGDCAKDW